MTESSEEMLPQPEPQRPEAREPITSYRQIYHYERSLFRTRDDMIFREFLRRQDYYCRDRGVFVGDGYRLFLEKQIDDWENTFQRRFSDYMRTKVLIDPNTLPMGRILSECIWAPGNNLNAQAGHMQLRRRASRKSKKASRKRKFNAAAIEKKRKDAEREEINRALQNDPDHLEMMRRLYEKWEKKHELAAKKELEARKEFETIEEPEPKETKLQRFVKPKDWLDDVVAFGSDYEGSPEEVEEVKKPDPVPDIKTHWDSWQGSFYAFEPAQRSESSDSEPKAIRAERKTAAQRARDYRKRLAETDPKKFQQQSTNHYKRKKKRREEDRAVRNEQKNQPDMIRSSSVEKREAARKRKQAQRAKSLKTSQ